MPAHEVNGDSLTIDGNTLQFDRDIFDTVSFEGFVIVLLQWTDDESPARTRNVYAVDRDASIRWQIDECPDEVGGRHSAYGGLHVVNGELWATTVVGISYKLNVETGEIVDKKIVK